MKIDNQQEYVAKTIREIHNAQLVCTLILQDSKLFLIWNFCAIISWFHSIEFDILYLGKTTTNSASRK